MTVFDTEWWKAHPTRMLEARNGPQAWAYEAQEHAIAGQLSMLASVLANTGERIATVLEVGCGFGRVTRVVRSVLDNQEHAPHYLATDASAEALDLARGYIGTNAGVEFDRLDLNEANDFAAIIVRALGGEDERADLVVCTEVLMHRTPEQVERDVALLCAMSGRYVLTCDWYEHAITIAAGCYRHDYDELFGRFGRVERYPLPKIRQAIWLTEIER